MQEHLTNSLDCNLKLYEYQIYVRVWLWYVFKEI